MLNVLGNLNKENSKVKAENLAVRFSMGNCLLIMCLIIYINVSLLNS